MIQLNHSRTISILSIRLLGGFHLHYGDKDLDTVNTTRLQALLAYLVLHRETPVSRQHIAFLFWPDSSEAQARTNLRNLLHKLRLALPNADQYISIDQHTLQWQTTAPFTLDVDEFLLLARQTSSIQALKAAAQNYSGDLLPDCYDDWVETLRESLRQTYISTLEKLLALLSGRRNLQEALYYAQLLLRNEPTREETYRHLMRLYAQGGDRASIARIYKTCVTVLDRELGVEPSPATDKTYKELMVQATDWSPHPETMEEIRKEPVLHNLPASLTSFIGRGKELEQVNILLSDHRLVTLMGPGGIGKTRLALTAGRENLSTYRDGIFLVDLAPLSEAGTVIAAIGDALQVSDEVRTAGLDGLVNHLRDQQVLLLLDNCEHLKEEVGATALALLQACPDVKILATSREVLNVYGETVWQVPALPAPETTENLDGQTQALQANESVTLFIERALSTLPTFSATPKALVAIGEICRRLEGMPLAIEMAAARVKTLSVHQIIQRLGNVLELLHPPFDNRLPRHRTMEAVIDWSYAMLTASERKLFTRLSVFAGDFSLQAVESICQGTGIQAKQILDLMASLVDKSLVETLPILPEARFRLHEIIRQYALKKLETPERFAVWRMRHVDYFVRLAEEAEPKLRGAEQLEWLNRLELEQENLRAALSWALEAGGISVNSAARAVSALWLFWFIRGRFSEGRRWAERALGVLEGIGENGPALGKVLYTLASFCFFQGDVSQAEVLSQRSLNVCKIHQDTFGQAVSYHHLGLIAAAQGALTEAAEYLHHGLKIATKSNDAWTISLTIDDLGILAFTSGDRESAWKRYQQSLEIARQSGDKFQILYNLTNLADLALQQKNLQQATMFTEESLFLSRLLGEKRGISFAFDLLGRIAMQEGRYQHAGKLLKESLQIIWSTRDRGTVIEYLVNLADLEVHQGNFEIAARLLAACEAALTSFPAGYRLRYYQEAFDRLVESIQARLDTGVFTAAWTLGRLMNLDQAVNFALLDHPSTSSP